MDLLIQSIILANKKLVLFVSGFMDLEFFFKKNKIDKELIKLIIFESTTTIKYYKNVIPIVCANYVPNKKLKEYDLIIAIDRINENADLRKAKVKDYFKTKKVIDLPVVFYYITLNTS
jgi:hypothetical protein